MGLDPGEVLYRAGGLGLSLGAGGGSQADGRQDPITQMMAGPQFGTGLLLDVSGPRHGGGQDAVSLAQELRGAGLGLSGRRIRVWGHGFTWSGPG
jgi:hypothetical protein